MHDLRQQGLTALQIINKLLEENLDKETIAEHFVAAFGFSDRVFVMIRLWDGKDEKLGRFIERKFAQKRFGGQPTLERVAHFYDVSVEDLLKMLDALDTPLKVQGYEIFEFGQSVYKGYVVTPDALRELDILLSHQSGRDSSWWSW